MSKLLKLLFILILVFSTYHLVRDGVQISGLDNSFSNVGHRSHEWCAPFCDYVTLPLDIVGIIAPVVILKRNRIGKLGATLLASTPLWIIFSVLP